MKSFKRFIVEEMENIRSISTSEQTALNKAISPYVYTVSKVTKNTTTVVIRAPKDDRVKVKKDLESKLTKAKIGFEAIRGGGSTGSTSIDYGKHQVRIIYKPTSGGMSETTLNSTITELAPALAFMNGKKSFPTVDAFYKFLQTARSNGVYVGSDEKAGNDFIASMPSSSKFKEKMENAMAILNYLWDEHKKSPIKQVYWGYRAKPAGISPSHKGDLFIMYNNGNMLGVSLKAGGEKTAEPQLNTYVNKFFDDIGNSSDKEKLISTVFQKIHSKIPLPKNWADRSEKKVSIDMIEELKARSEVTYDKMYNEMLEIVRSAVIDAVNKSMKDTMKYIEKQIIKKDVNVPLVVVKAYGKKYKFVTDEDAIDLFLPKVTSIKAYPSTSSKQNWFIDLQAKGEKLTLNMSLRSNKPMPDNKIAQGFNLALKFNGIS